MILAWRAGAAALLIIGLGGCACGKAHAAASDPVLLGQFNDWNAYTYKASDTMVCYISARPKTSTPKVGKRDPAFFLVTNMPGRKVKGQISTIIGYAFKKASSVEVKVDDASFSMFTKADVAWADTPENETKIVAAMKGGQTLTVKGTSWRNTQTLDTYSLDGVSAAIAKIDEACK